MPASVAFPKSSFINTNAATRDWKTVQATERRMEHNSSNLLMYHVRWKNEFFLYSTGDDAHDMLDNFPCELDQNGD